MHEIQKHILKTLLSTTKTNFSKLKPKGVESNKFVYHLKKLAREDYIKLQDGKYSLTDKGESYVENLSLKTLTPRIQPKIISLLIIKKNKKYLFYRRNRKPFMDKVGFPYGKIHLGEKLMGEANRELKEKANLVANLKYVGHAYTTVHREEKLLTHTLFHVFFGKDPKGQLKTDASIGECFWAEIKDIKKAELIPGVIQIEKLLKESKGHFFKEFFLNI